MSSIPTLTPSATTIVSTGQDGMGLLSNWPKLRKSLADAYAPRPKISYVVEGLFPAASLNIVYGSPGSLKSFLLADLAVCVASGRVWLEPEIPETLKIRSFPTVQSPVIWVDFDNGMRRTNERFDALGKKYGLSTDTPLYYYSMPYPRLNAGNHKLMMEFSQMVQYEGAGLVVVDNLGTVSGGVDENSSSMLPLMGNFRTLAEVTGAAVILIHHTRKGANSNGKIGDSLRGFSGIRGAIDYGLIVNRDFPDSPTVSVKAEKARDADIPLFAAKFWYWHKMVDKKISNDLELARFYGAVPSASQKSGQENDEEEIQEAVLEVLAAGKMNQIKLATKVREEYFPDVGINRIKNIIKQMAAEGTIRYQKGQYGEYQYYLP